MPQKSYNTLLDEHLHILVAQGNHEAFEQLKKRYHFHAINLCRDILKQYENTGIMPADLVIVCDSIFRSIVEKYDAELSSFFSFWKQLASHQIMEYLTDNSYTAEASSFSGSISIDQEFEDNHTFADMLCEIDDNRMKRKKIAEVKRIIVKYAVDFTKQEKAMLNLILEGYSIPDLEHSGVMSRSSLYLTFNTAVEKLQNIINGIRNKK